MDLSRVNLFVTDMDGSLLNSRHEVSDRFFELFELFKHYGIHFAAASGRQRESILEKLAPIKDQIIVIAENGAYASMNGKEISATTLAPELKDTVLSTIHGLPDVYPILCARGNAYIKSGQPEFEKYMQEYYTAHTTLDKLEDFREEVFKIALYHPKDSEAFIYPSTKHLEPSFKVKVSGQHWVDVSHPDAHKGNALRQVQQRLNISKDNTIGVGDFFNDLEMLEESKYSFAMENAHPEVKKAARYATRSNDELGVEWIMEQLLRQKGCTDL